MLRVIMLRLTILPTRPSTSLRLWNSILQADLNLRTTSHLTPLGPLGEHDKGAIRRKMPSLITAIASWQTFSYNVRALRIDTHALWAPYPSLSPQDKY
jgi:hypothetical protein